MMNKKQGSGFTLIELMITVAIVGILASLAVPSFEKMIERNRLKEVAEGLKSDLMWMRTEAIKQSCDLQADFDNTGWTYEIYQQAGGTGACVCTGAANCRLKVVDGSQFSGITMGAASFLGLPNTTASFDFRRGNTAKNGGVILNSSSYQLKVIVSPAGRVRVCSSDSSKSVVGYDDC